METTDSGEASPQGGNLFDYYYENVSDQAELSKRTKLTKVLNGQAAFFTLLTRLGVPVLDSNSNLSGGQDHLFVGLGASYRVTQAIFPLPNEHSFTINRSTSDFGKLQAALKIRRYVTKRIVPNASSKMADGQHLAAIANEVRILAGKTLKESDFLVKLLCVAWDEIPTFGRHWPRLLLEAADYGNLGEFLLSGPPDGKTWGVKLQIILDVMTGLKALHDHGVVHCDLKLENVLVFRAANKDNHPLKIDYQAKICDFGFSVIMTDYEEDATFSERLGTEPWSSPELSFATEIKIKDLPQSDIYSFGLLSSRVFMNGGDPFGELTREEIKALKCNEDGNELSLHNTITKAIFSQVIYTNLQRALIEKPLLTTLGFLPEHRFPLHVLGAEYVLYSCLKFTNHENPPVDQSSKNGETTGTEAGAPEVGRMTHVVASAPGILIKRRLQNTLSYCLPTFFASLGLLRRGLRMATTWLLRSAQKRLGLLHDPFEDLLKPKEIYVEPIASLLSGQSFGDNDNEVDGENLKDIPDFEYATKYSPATLSKSIAYEIVQNLLQIACGSGRHGSMREAEASYQLGVAYFEGIGVPKDPEEGLQWLERAALRGSKKALTGSPNIFASMGRSMPLELSIACDSALPDLAKHEVHWASSLVFDGQFAQYETFSALRRFIRIAPGELDEYLMSSKYNALRAAFFAVCLIKKHRVQQVDSVQKAKENYDFSLLEGYKPFANEKFNVSDKNRFIQSVRQHRCLQRTDFHCMTLLQLAAARGDLELTKTLVLDLEASADACGVLPGLTPLWISCFNGHIDIALFLVQQGAMPTCRDSISGRTILHFLNQFQKDVDIRHVLEIGLKAGLSLDEKDNHGHTPLMSTFVGWDFSNGFASKLLLAYQADILVQSNDDWSPMWAAVNSLNVETSQAIAEKFYASNLHATVDDVKATAFCALCSQTQFNRRRVGGEESFKKLQFIVELLIDEGMVNAFRRSKVGRGSNPLIGASYLGHDDLTIAVLNSTHCPGLDEVDELNSMSALHWSVERGRVTSAMKMLSLGANPFLRDKRGLNIFHRAAQFSPSLLLQILENIDSANLPRPAGHDTGSILTMATPEGYTPFVIAIIEGSSEHLKMAEALRKKYCIDHDSYSLQKSGTATMMTLMASLILHSVASNLFTLEQVEYVLNIDPRPRFIADTSGDTLLHYAVGGWQNGERYLASLGDRTATDICDIKADISSNHAGYAVLRLLLRIFPGREHLDTTNNQGYTPIHLAVYYANVIALEIIKDHLISLGQELDPNFTGSGAPRPLNGLGRIRQNLRLKEEDQPWLYAILKKNTAKTYALMRDLGSCLESEREGAIICIFIRVQSELTKGRLVRFLEASRRAFRIEWEFIEADIPSSAAGTEEASFAVEFCWAFDDWVLRARPILTEDIGSYYEERAKARWRITEGEQKFPWTETAHEEVFLGHRVKWTRRGRAWTIEERRELVTKIENAWLAMFPNGHGTRIVVPTRTTWGSNSSSSDQNTPV